MSQPHQGRQTTDSNTLRTAVDRQIQRDARTRRNRGHDPVWFGLGTFGLIGWSIAVPAVCGTLLGLWMDRGQTPTRASWTLTLLLAGTALGCLNAYYWLHREHHAIYDDEETMP